jgi:acyl carrier protein
MEHNDILKTVINIMEDVFDSSALNISTTTTANDVEDWDSLNHIQLVVAIEKKFKVRFTTSEIQNWKDVGDMVQSISTKLQVANG